MDDLEAYCELVRHAGQLRGDSQEQIEERCRFVEILLIHAKAGWVKQMAVTRIVNFISDPQGWEEWKQRGGDSGTFLG